MQIQANTNAGDSVVQVRTFINYWTFFDSRRERERDNS